MVKTFFHIEREVVIKCKNNFQPWLKLFYSKQKTASINRDERGTPSLAT